MNGPGTRSVTPLQKGADGGGHVAIGRNYQRGAEGVGEG
jgi:hypothetical protein